MGEFRVVTKGDATSLDYASCAPEVASIDMTRVWQKAYLGLNVGKPHDMGVA